LGCGKDDSSAFDGHKQLPVIFAKTRIFMTGQGKGFMPKTTNATTADSTLESAHDMPIGYVGFRDPSSNGLWHREIQCPNAGAGGFCGEGKGDPPDQGSLHAATRPGRRLSRSRIAAQLSLCLVEALVSGRAGDDTHVRGRQAPGGSEPPKIASLLCSGG
jgi:hypothetical protein